MKLTCFLRPQSQPLTAYNSQRNNPPVLCGGDNNADENIKKFVKS